MIEKEIKERICCLESQAVHMYKRGCLLDFKNEKHLKDSLIMMILYHGVEWTENFLNERMLKVVVCN